MSKPLPPTPTLYDLSPQFHQLFSFYNKYTTKTISILPNFNNYFLLTLKLYINFFSYSFLSLFYSLTFLITTGRSLWLFCTYFFSISVLLYDQKTQRHTEVTQKPNFLTSGVIFMDCQIMRQITIFSEAVYKETYYCKVYFI